MTADLIQRLRFLASGQDDVRSIALDEAANALEAMAERQAPAEAHEAADTVQLVGVKDGAETVIGTATMPPEMKARELVREMFGAWEPDDGSDADMAFAICEQLIKWMPKNPPTFNVESKAQPKGTATVKESLPVGKLTRKQIDDIMTEHYPLDSLLSENVDAFEACVRDIEKALATQAPAPAPEASAQELVDNMCRLGVWWTHNRAKFTTPRQAAFAAWNEAFRTAIASPAVEPGAPAKASTPLIIDVLARWEDQNGSLACVLASEWDALRQEVMDAAVIESPRMARNRLEALAAQPHTAALAARSATAIACLPDAPYKVALQKLHDDMLAAIAAQSQAAPVAQWQPIETAPKDGTEILGHEPRIGALVIYWLDDRWTDGMSRFERKPTLWMPILPVPASLPPVHHMGEQP